MSSNVARGKTVGRVQERLSRLFKLESKYLVDNAQTEPMRVLFGRDTLSMTQLMPVFNIVTKNSDSRSSGKSGGKGNVDSSETELYYGGVVFGICVGQIYSIYKISSGEKTILKVVAADDLFGLKISAENSGWGEDYNLWGAENNGVWDNDLRCYKLDISGYGTLRIYSGQKDQKIDSAFYDYEKNEFKTIDYRRGDGEDGVTTAEGPWPAYRNIAYLVSDSFLLGTSNRITNLMAEVQVNPYLFANDYIDSGGVVEDFEEHTTGLKHNKIPICNNQGDTYVPLIIYEYLVDKTWGGAGLSKENIDLDSFYNALKICINEEIAISACMDSNITIRDAISQLLQYVDGVLYLNKDNKIAIKLIRTPNNYSALKVITEADLIEEPEVTWQGEDDTWGMTKVSFCSRSDEYESTSEVFESPRYLDRTLAEIKTREFDLPFVKTRLLASRLARKLGNEGATQSYEIEFKLLKSSVDFNVGDLILFNYEKFNIKNYLLRINSISLSDPGSLSVSVSAVKQVETDWEVEVIVDNLSSGWPSRLTGWVDVPDGFLQPFCLGVFGENNKGEMVFDHSGCCVFIERNENIAATGYAIQTDKMHGSALEDRALSKLYQTRIKLLEWGIKKDINSEEDKNNCDEWDNEKGYGWKTDENGNRQFLTTIPYIYLKFEAEGEKRKKEILKLFEYGTRGNFITFFAFKNPSEILFAPEYLTNSVILEMGKSGTFLTMSFRVTEINEANNDFYNSEYSADPILKEGTTDTWIWTIKVNAENNISGGVYPDTFTENEKYYPAETGFIYKYDGPDIPFVYFFNSGDRKYYLDEWGYEYRDYFMFKSNKIEVIANAIIPPYIEAAGGSFVQVYRKENYFNFVPHLRLGDDFVYPTEEYYKGLRVLPEELKEEYAWADTPADEYNPAHRYFFTIPWGFPVCNSGLLNCKWKKEQNLLEVQLASSDEENVLYIDTSLGDVYYISEEGKEILYKIDVETGTIVKTNAAHEHKKIINIPSGAGVSNYFVINCNEGKDLILISHAESENELTRFCEIEVSKTEIGREILIVAEKNNNLNGTCVLNIKITGNNVQDGKGEIINELKASSGCIIRLVKITENNWRAWREVLI